MGWRSSRFTHSQQESKALKEVGKVVAPTEGQGHEEGANLGTRSVRSYFRCGFFTILDNVLIIGESARGEERADLPHPHPGGLREGSGGGCEKKRGGGLTEALRWWYERGKKCGALGGGPINKGFEVNFVIAITVLFISAVRVVSIPTPYQ